MHKMMSVKELLNHYAAGERDFSEIKLFHITDNRALNGFELKDVDLSGANFSKGYFLNGQLERVNLSGANLSNVQIVDTSMENVNLSRANLSSSVLQGVTFRISCLEGVNFENAVLVESGMDDSCINDSNFSGAEFYEASFTRCTFTGATVNINELRGCYLTQTLLPDGEIFTNGIQD
jgi:uncharacterized protein YjbI with pentapeptide repeats